MQRTILFLLFVIFLSHLIFRLFSFKDNYFSRFDPDYWENRYNQSQWIVLNSRNPIGDDGLFSYAAWKYVHGENPASIVPEYPPLGKYFLGISILIFGNQNIFALVVGFLVLIIFYLLNLDLFNKNKLYAFIPVFLFSLEPLFYEQLKAPYFDLLYLLFLLLTFLFFHRHKYFLSSLFLGCFASIKFPSMVAVIIMSMFFYLLMNKNIKGIKKYLISLSLVPIVYVLSYFRYFLLGNSIIGFLKVQKWIINFYLIGAKGKIFSIFPLIIFGRWHTWWSGEITVNEWTILWPVIFVVSLFFSIKIISQGDFSSKFYSHALWLVFFFLFMSFIPVWPRYLLLVLPFMYNLFVWVFLRNIPKKSFFA